MSPHLDARQIEQFQNLGFTVAPTFFAPQEVKAMQLELERLLASGEGRDVCPLPGRHNIQFTPIGDMSPLFGSLPFHPGLANALSRLIGDPLLLWLDQIYHKPARTGVGNSWHEDNSRFKVPDVRLSAGAWIALHDSNQSNGTLEIVPNSFYDSKLALPFRQPTAEEESEAEVIEMPAGGVAFFNFGMLHCTRDNHSAAPRAAAVYHFINGSNLPEESFLGFGRNIPVTGVEDEF